MALPNIDANGNISEDGTLTGLVPSPSFSPSTTITSFPTQAYNSTSNVTCDFATDTFLYRADGAIWCDTHQAWISVDKVNFHGTR